MYDEQNFIAEYDGSNNLLASYVQGAGIDRPIGMFRSGAMYWYHSDALGSIYQMTDSSQNVARSYDYSAFGKIISETGSLANPFTYTAREFDSESGLYYYRARYYDAGTGRFLGRDPIYTNTGKLRKTLDAQGLGRLNLYGYAFNDPTNLADPTGEQPAEILWAIAMFELIGGLFAVMLAIEWLHECETLRTEYEVRSISFLLFGWAACCFGTDYDLHWYYDIFGNTVPKPEVCNKLPCGKFYL